MFLFVCAGLATGHFTAVSLSDPSVEYVKDYVNTKLPLLFPDARGTPEIAAAERQTAAGYNLKLLIKIPRGLSFTVTLWVNAQRRIRVTAIAAAPPRKNLAGGYRWHPISSLTANDLKSLETLLAEQSSFMGKIAGVLAVRTQIVAGTNRHVIFTDEEGTLYSAVVHTNVKQKKTISTFKRVAPP
jgi:hypothetical protein